MEPSWQHVGETPIRDRRTPRGLLRWRIEKAGFNAFEDAIEFESAGRCNWREPRGAVGMVRVIAGARANADDRQRRVSPGMTFSDFWIDRNEVTNRQFSAFVETGGYQKPEFWKHPFVTANDKVVSWGEAMITSGTRQVGRGRRPGCSAGSRGAGRFSGDWDQLVRSGRV